MIKTISTLRKLTSSFRPQFFKNTGKRNFASISHLQNILLSSFCLYVFKENSTSSEIRENQPEPPQRHIEFLKELIQEFAGHYIDENESMSKVVHKAN
jgi:hypothetical protein